MIKFLKRLPLICVILVLLTACTKSEEQDEPSGSYGSAPSTTEVLPGAIAQAPLPRDSKTSELPKIYWAKPNYPPLFFYEGPKKNAGIGDNAHVLLQNNIEGFKHIDYQANYPRMMMDMRRGKSVCAFLHYSEERAEYLHFTNTLVVTPSYQLYVNKLTKEHLDKVLQRDVQSESFGLILSNNQNLILAKTPEHSFGVERNRVIQEHSHLLKFDNNYSKHSTLIKRLAGGRAHMTLVLPWVFNYEKKQLSLNTPLYKIQLNDMPASVESRVGCSKTPEGESVINAINTMQPPAHDLLKDVIVDWLTPQEVTEYRAVYADFFGINNQTH